MYRVTQVALGIEAEGRHAGQAAVLIRLADGGGSDSAEGVVAQALAARPPVAEDTPSFVVVRGEPSGGLGPLIDGLRRAGFRVAIVAAGKGPLPCPCPDWLVVDTPDGVPDPDWSWGDELRVSRGVGDATLELLSRLSFRHFYLRPAGPDSGAYDDAVRYCLGHPRWRLLDGAAGAGPGPARGAVAPPAVAAL